MRLDPHTGFGGGREESLPLTPNAVQLVDLIRGGRAAGAHDIHKLLRVETRRLRGRGDARAVGNDDVLDEDVAARAVEGDVESRRRFPAHGRRRIHRAFDIEKRRHLGLPHQPHRIQIQAAVRRHGADGPKRATAKIPDVVPLHHGGIRVVEKAPVRQRASEEFVRYLPAMVAEGEKCQPAVGDLMREHRQRAPLPQRLRRWIVGILAEGVHDREALQPSGTAKAVREIVDVDPEPPNVIRDGRLVRERVADNGDIGPNDQLIVGVWMRAVELRGHRDGIQLNQRREAFTNRSRPAARRPGHAQIDGGKLRGRPRRHTDDRILQRDVAEFHLDAVVRQQRRLGIRDSG